MTLPKQYPMVGWYDPRQLAKTGIEVAISTIFGRHSDHRLVEAMASSNDAKAFFDYSRVCQDNGEDPNNAGPRNSIWIDFVGDVGDGWNSTYAVASHLAEPGRCFKYTDRETKQNFEADTKRGEVLIFGGDEVYPTASRTEYERRLVAPYESAFKNSSPPHPDVFAIPGNHDWYDSLVAFTRLFTARPWFAGWRTRQTRSYFALKLPHNWWLLGTDVQLGSDIDGPQMDYFKNLTTEMDKASNNGAEPARIILCHAEPHWIRAAQWGGEDPAYNESNLKLLERRLGKNIAVFIAGDLHHYRRHESEDKSTQKITAGGGGAFLHPTHYGRYGKSLDVLVEKGLRENETRNFRLEGCFPPTSESENLTWRNLIFPYLKGNESRSFGVVTAVLYLLLTLTILNNLEPITLVDELSYVTFTSIKTIVNSVPAIVMVLATFVGFVFFTDTHSTWYRLVMGGLHGIFHIVAAFFIAIGTVFLIDYITPNGLDLKIPWFGGFEFSPDLRILIGAILIMFFGFVVGSFIMGLYLLVSLNLFGKHGNEAFSSISVEDWKNFLRLHINEKGDLTIYPVGIRRVPRKWKRREGTTGPELVPDDPNATDPELIEPPIVMKAASTKSGVETTSPDTKIESASQTSEATKE